MCGGLVADAQTSLLCGATFQRNAMSLRKLVGFIHPRIAVVAHDLAMTALAWWIAKMLRYAFNPDEIVSFQLLEFPIVLLVQGLILRWTGLYKSVWRFASLPDLWNIARAVVIGALGDRPVAIPL
jgi:hypothetical protein